MPRKKSTDNPEKEIESGESLGEFMLAVKTEATEDLVDEISDQMFMDSVITLARPITVVGLDQLHTASDFAEPSVPLKIFSKSGEIPKFSTPGSACFDIKARLEDGDLVKTIEYDGQSFEKSIRNTQLRLKPGSRALIPTGLFFDIPEESHLEVFSRSGLSWKSGLILTNGVGIIDSDYIEELFISVTNISGKVVIIQNNDRIAQAKLVQNLRTSLEPMKAQARSKTNRTGGFGSTGK